jgi:hypothetical protein
MLVFLVVVIIVSLFMRIRNNPIATLTFLLIRTFEFPKIVCIIVMVTNLNRQLLLQITHSNLRVLNVYMHKHLHSFMIFLIMNLDFY